MFRKTTMRRAIIEGALIYTAGLFLALPSPDVWPTPLFFVVLFLRLALLILPPVWTTLRVLSTKREKMSRRFWLVGLTLAAWCAGVSTLFALAIGVTDIQWGGLLPPPEGSPAFARFFASGAAHLSPLTFLGGQLLGFVLLAIYYTIAVVLTRLANGGFMRFTMPAGGGRVTL